MKDGTGEVIILRSDAMYVVDVQIGCKADPVAFGMLTLAETEDDSLATWFSVFEQLFDSTYI